MSPPRESLGPLELDVLQYVADHHPITVREVARYFAETSGQARTTLLTIMERLRSKGYLGRRKVDGVHQYRPKITKADLLHGLVGNFVEDVLGGSMSPFIAYLAKAPNLTEAEARRVEQLLRELEARDKESK
ncbi:MAG TPA: BlaI/MecI/CopY family transcriptional regulator [Pirellulales bacterium]|jgi:predicted transcriptional regulator